MIGLTGTKARSKEGKVVEGYNLSLGGSQGADPQIGNLHQKSIPKSEIKIALKKILIDNFDAKKKKIKSKSINPFPRFKSWVNSLVTNKSP